MARKSWTLLILPGESTTLRRVELTQTRLVLAAAVVGLLVLCAIAVPQLMLRLDRSVETATALEQQNRDLQAERDQFESKVASLSGRLQRFEAQAGGLARELGLDELVAVAAGGEGEMPQLGEGVTGELGQLSARATHLGDSLAQIDEAFRQRLQVLATTPNQMPVQGWFSHGYGWRKDPWTGQREFHRGVDIVADIGTPILAPADGLVSQTGRKPDYGKMVDISHGNGYVTRYAHLSEILVRPGQQIARGEILGRVGSTGRSTGPHLHYEVFRDGRRVNPWKYIGQKGR